MRSRPNVSDVARKAGVSAATVSRAFNAPSAVRLELREKVLKAARALGYSPNPAAKALRMQRTHMVGAIIPTLNYDIFARMINAFQTRLSTSGTMVMLTATGFDNRVLEAPARQLVERGAEALLVVGEVMDEGMIAFIRERQIPVVTTYSFSSNGPYPSIGFDNYAAARELTEHIIGLGHKHIAMIAAQTAGNDRQTARVAAFKATAAKKGLARTACVIERVHAIVDGAEAMRSLREAYPATTAVICNSDVLAFGALSECKRLGLKVPRDISITGFDDQELAALVEPPLTTVAVPAAEMGERAANILLAAINGDAASAGPFAGVRLETRLVVRGSTGPARS